MQNNKFLMLPSLVIKIDKLANLGKKKYQNVMKTHFCTFEVVPLCNEMTEPYFLCCFLLVFFPTHHRNTHNTHFQVMQEILPAAT